MDLDVKAIVEKVVDKAKNDPKFMDSLKKDPEKALESVTGIDIPDGAVDQVVAGVKAKVSLDKVAGIANLLKK